MNIKLIAPVLIASASILSANAFAQDTGLWDGKFKKRFYIGIGAGLSNLDPDTSDVPGVDVVDDSDAAGLLTLGLDFSRRFTAELQFADLGEVGLTGGNAIGYSEVTVSGLYYIWNGLAGSDFLDYDGLDRRAGLSFYGRFGVGVLDNDQNGTIGFERENDAQLVLGLGAEYALRFGLGIRAEFISYDSDAQFGGLSLLYRFGGRRQETKEPALNLPTIPTPKPVETLPTLPPPPPPPPPPEFLPPVDESPEPLVSVTPEDNDGDGVNNELDECNQTPLGTPVGADGCALFNGTLDGVNFLSGSDTLTDNARLILDDAISTIETFPDVRISVQAHTDSAGTEDANLDLSRRRALAVVRYLTAQGVSIDRLEARAFGEARPIADNSTRAGRLLNRRVEFRTF